MKRFLNILVFAILVLFVLTACGKPNDVSPEMYDIGIAVLQIADDYIDYKIDGDQANIKLSALVEDAQTIYERNKGTNYGVGDLSIKCYIDRLSSEFHIAEYKGVPSDIKDARNTLAKSIGK